MNIQIQAIKFNASEKLEAYAQKKINKLEKLLDNITSVEVFFKLTKIESTENKEVEIKVNIPNTSFFAAKTCNSFEEAIDKTLEAIEKQIKKHKDKK